MTVRGTVGKIAQVPSWVEGGVVTANLLRLVFDPGLVGSLWVKHYLLARRFQDALDLACSATTIKTIQVPRLAEIYVLRPPLLEQEVIGRIADQLDRQIRSEAEMLHKLRVLKVGLSNVLLTGRVRVTKLLEGDAV
jgi:type I restriction enzyme S subunit